MSFTTSGFLFFTFFNILVQIHSLVDLPVEEDYGIIETERTIRNTLNKLFSSLKVKEVKNKSKLKQYSKIHNFFVSITLQDHNHLNNIARLSRVDYIDNSVQIFITLINAVLDEENKNDDETDAVYITMFIQTFLDGLDNLKEVYGIKHNASNLEVNKQVIKYLSSDEINENGTQFHQNVNDTSDNVLDDIESWQMSEVSGRRIYKGERVSIKKFPFMAGIQFFKKFQCAGSIIKSDLIISSAACLQLAWNNRFFRENPAFLSVMVGSEFYEVGDEVIPVLELFFHPGYDPKFLRHNLVILRLVRRLNLKKKKRIKKIEIDRNPSPMPENTDGITVVGWGSRGTSNMIDNPFVNRLSYAVLDYYPLRECQEIYSTDYVTSKHFCAGFFSKGGGACNRDAGGPGINSGLLMGVISFGSPTCGAVDAPTVFTKLGFYTDWIEEIMEEERVVSVQQRTTHKPSHRNTFAFNYKKQETTFEIQPVMNFITTTTVEPLAVPGKLRIGHEDRGEENFKDFLSTMFESGEIDEYLAKGKFLQQETEENYADIESKIMMKPAKKPKLKAKSKSKSKTSKHKSKTSFKTKTPSRVTRKVINIKPPTKLVDFDDYDRATTAYKHYRSTAKTRYETKTAHNSEEDRKADQVIERLVDQLDTEDFLNLGLSEDLLELFAEASLPFTGDERAYSQIDERVKESANSESKEMTSKSSEGANDAILTLLYMVKSKHNKKLSGKDKIYKEPTKKVPAVRSKTILDVRDKIVFREQKINVKTTRKVNEYKNSKYETYVQGGNIYKGKIDESDNENINKYYHKNGKKRKLSADSDEDEPKNDNVLRVASTHSKKNKVRRTNDTETILKMLKDAPDIYELIANAIENH